ncbi:uncharacterized protein OCT59_010649 [Rhizophagus irregularis]|uniref:uncharacterized protein n=1 Tax=Rhizophagus irregularis TaxID=588596 RepID=UPI0019DDEA63|nr:hypothetical protein OCT59_010649 [Rhizophagus irregularis]GET52237.1 hypothetical protein GLOIN_2v1739631 [Rhizophagus irregularis DAOM 181602=DAOM 197198]
MVSHFFRCLGAWKIWWSSNIGRMGIWRPVLGCVESCNLDSQFSGRVDFSRESTIKTSYCRYIVDLHEESEGVAYAKIEFIIQHKANNGQYYTFFLFN